MLTQLLYYLLFETIQPSYNTFASVLPPEIVVEAAAAPTLLQEKAPVKKTASIAPVIEADSVYALDLTSGSPLFTHDIFTRRKIASISKLVAAMIILDNHKLDETTVVSKNAAEQEGSRVWLREGEKVTVENLLRGLLINSGNDAAVALAEFDAGSETAFVKKMNIKAASLGLKDTHFSNAKGFDQEQNYSTAYDTVIFSRTALSYPFIKETVKTKKGEFVSQSGIRHSLESTNELLENPHFKVIGLKTGKTPAAKESFVGLTEGPNGHEILTVVLGSPDRFKETKILIDWVFRNYDFP